ncbi:MAG: Calcineurin subunit B [Chaenotheca gracillima]|nr:MAG: Calcineurin subunit B [Chaenotheca gracillima]
MLNKEGFPYHYEPPDRSPQDLNDGSSDTLQTISSPPRLTWKTHEREYAQYVDRFLKRSLRPEEYQRNFLGQIHVPYDNKNRLANEAASLRYIKQMTNVPVPAVLDAYEQEGSFYLWTELVRGIPMKELSRPDQAVVMREVEQHLLTLHELHFGRVGGPSGIISPPPRATSHFDVHHEWVSAPTAGLVFCHNDLSQSNILVNPDDLKISGIIDWEFAGYYPSYFEAHFFRDPRPSGAQMRDLGDDLQLVDFLSQHCQTDRPMHRLSLSTGS